VFPVDTVSMVVIFQRTSHLI